MVLKKTALATSGASIGTHIHVTYLQVHSLFTKLLVLQGKNIFTTQNLTTVSCFSKRAICLPWARSNQNIFQEDIFKITY